MNNIKPFIQEFEKIKNNLEIIKHNNKECLIDQSKSFGDRHYYRPKTPEEIVRQSFIYYLLHYLNFSKQSLNTEKSLGTLSSKNHETKNKRVDLVINKYGQDILIVEFKNENISLIQSAYKQGEEYALYLAIPYLMLCNGRQINFYSVKNGNLKPIGENEILEKLHEFKDQVKSEKLNYIFDDDYFAMERTQRWSVPYLKELQNKIIYSSINGSLTSQFKVIKDLGYDKGVFKNPSGSKGLPAVYHFYEIEFDDKNRNILGISIAKYDKPIENLKTANILTIGIGNKSCLEIWTSEKFIKNINGEIVLTHNGGIGGIKGSNKKKCLDIFKEVLPDLYNRQHNNISFGKINYKIDETKWNEIILNIIRYAIEREKIKKELKVRTSQFAI